MPCAASLCCSRVRLRVLATNAARSWYVCLLASCMSFFVCGVCVCACVYVLVCMCLCVLSEWWKKTYGVPNITHGAECGACVSFSVHRPKNGTLVPKTVRHYKRYAVALFFGFSYLFAGKTVRRTFTWYTAYAFKTDDRTVSKRTLYAFWYAVRFLVRFLCTVYRRTQSP